METIELVGGEIRNTNFCIAEIAKQMHIANRLKALELKTKYPEITSMVDEIIYSK